MNKDELTRRLARKWHRSRAQAADDVDTLVYRLLKDLKQPANGAPEPKSSAMGATTKKVKP